MDVQPVQTSPRKPIRKKEIPEDKTNAPKEESRGAFPTNKSDKEVEKEEESSPVAMALMKERAVTTTNITPVTPLVSTSASEPVVDELEIMEAGGEGVKTPIFLISALEL
jgi:hypothetical protein